MTENELNRLPESEKPRYTISQAAEILEISVHTMRMYEKEGLIIPFQKDTGHRLYSQSDIDRLKCIRNGINHSKISINGIKALYSLIPCWEIKQCSEEERKDCSSYNSHGTPCWMFDHENNLCADEACRYCPVYKDFTDCNSIKEKIKNLMKSKV